MKKLLSLFIVLILPLFVLASCDSSSSSTTLPDSQAKDIAYAVAYTNYQAYLEANPSSGKTYATSSLSVTDNQDSLNWTYNFTNYTKTYNGNDVIFQSGTCKHKWDTSDITDSNKTVETYSITILYKSVTYKIEWKDKVTEKSKSIDIDGNNYTVTVDETQFAK